MSQNDSSGSPPDLYAVLDTNILLHFPFLNEIDWLKVLQAKHPCLVVTLHLLRELDDIKDGMTRSGRRELAQRVYRKIGELIEPEPLNQPFPLAGRPGTSLMYFDKDELDIDPKLRQEKQDDALIAAALHLKDAGWGGSQDAVVLLSADSGCRQRAKGFGIKALSLPHSMQRPLPPTEEEKRLKKYEQLEPQVQIDFGAQGDLLVLPYTTKRNQLNDVRASYDTQIKNTVQALEEDYAFLTNGDPRREPKEPFGDRELSYYYRRDQHLILALREVGVSIMSELLTPQPKVRDYQTHDAALGVRPQYQRWQRNVDKLYSLTQERRADLFAANQELQLYRVPIVLTHVGGIGIEDGEITVTIEQPFRFIMTKPQSPDDARNSYQPERTKWRSVPETPSAVQDTPLKKSYSFGNFHPGKALVCDPLYIYVDPKLNLLRDGITSVLTVEVSGLNVRFPISKVVKVEPL